MSHSITETPRRTVGAVRRAAGILANRRRSLQRGIGSIRRRGAARGERPAAISVVWRRCGLPLLVLGALGMSRGAAAPQGGDLFTQIYGRSILKQRSMTSLRATFTETTTSSLLTRPIVARGTILAAPPGRVRMTYQTPEPKVLTMDGRTLAIAWPDRNQREQIDVREVQKRIDRYFRDASLGELRSMFDITAAPDSVLTHADRIEMTPKRKQIKAGLEKLELWIDRDAQMLAQMRMTFPGGAQKTIALEEVAINVPIDDAMFQP